MRHFTFLSVNLVPHRQGLSGHLSSKAVGVWHTEDARRMIMGSHYHRTSSGHFWDPDSVGRRSSKFLVSLNEC